MVIEIITVINVEKKVFKYLSSSRTTGDHWRKPVEECEKTEGQYAKYHRRESVVRDSSKAKIILIFIIAAFLAAASFFFFFFKSDPDIKIGWVTDIHAGGQKDRKQTERNIVYPREYDEYFSAILKTMRDEGIGTVITTGDNTDKGEPKYAQKLVEIARENNMNIIWTKGNHDRDKYEIMKQLGAERNYYFADIGNNIRIIVLNNAKLDIYPNGEIDNEQLEWFKDVLKNTNKYKKVILVMHVPIFDPENNDSICLQYSEFEKIISSNSNIIFVLAGHKHNEYHTVINGVDYWTGFPLTLKDHKGSYYIIDVKNKEINAHNAQL